MLKKAGFVAATAAGLMVFGAPAFAAPAGPPATSGTAGVDQSAASSVDTDENDLTGLLILEDDDVLDNDILCAIFPNIAITSTTCVVQNNTDNQNTTSSTGDEPK
ncbi:hypothetical protein [Goodfellowiella coeruleoviolacea]|uniref:Secreted protein n=1 Tax=Goodfellowiella coeruleoviolacea TaxID=334858 RepID=A0AAE3GCD4_9PSEU|nr:hypothetical protein [Goodfellowiella coeruleoviolacea]MCP2165686.1 hypothetical protein [Goodfellowiella coeruleoviolacea]